ncbi:MAG: redoxin domain-containing protein [SAR324 cluster bacterium]|nr:redoxin domain-containing protein [SAR324 cluster bacterium]
MLGHEIKQTDYKLLLKLYTNDRQQLLDVGTFLPNFHLFDQKFNKLTLRNYEYIPMLINVILGIETSDCIKVILASEKLAKRYPCIKFLVITKDLPFSLAKFHEEHKIKHVTLASAFSDPMFAKNYQVLVGHGHLKGLFYRTTILTDYMHKVLWRDSMRNGNAVEKLNKLSTIFKEICPCPIRFNS